VTAWAGVTVLVKKRNVTSVFHIFFSAGAPYICFIKMVYYLCLCHSGLKYHNGTFPLILEQAGYRLPCRRIVCWSGLLFTIANNGDCMDRRDCTSHKKKRYISFSYFLFSRCSIHMFLINYYNNQVISLSIPALLFLINHDFVYLYCNRRRISPFMFYFLLEVGVYISSKNKKIFSSRKTV
jgi:hypothetical protein